jgi:DNA-binding LacI/PurR family transcriptional regulator
MRSATITDIARAAGVAPSTVSRALQNHPRISPERCAAIQSLADRMGYRPSLVARSLVTGHTRTLGVVVTDVTDPFVAEVMRGAEAASREAGYTLLFAMSNRDPVQEMASILLLLQREVEGLIVISGRAGDEYARLRAERDGEWPLVLVNNEQPGPAIYTVRMDNRDGVAQAIVHLQVLGHSNIAFIAGPEHGRSSQERLNGYRAAMAEGGREHVIQGEGTLQDGERALETLRALRPAPTAVLCYNDLAALGLIAAATRAGMRVPDDLSVMGFDDIAMSAFSAPPLTTIRQPTGDLGRAAVDVCLGALEGRCPEPRILRGELVIRQSTAVRR